MEHEDQKLNDLFSRAKRLSLSSHEKSVMRSNIEHFMRQNAPVPQQVMFVAVWNVFKKPALTYSFAALLVFIALGSGVSLAANSSLPGDVLYPVKVGVNEKVLGFVQFSNEAKAHYDLQLVETRLEELEEVAVAEKLDDSTKTKIVARLNKHIERAQERSEAIREKNKDEESDQIDSQLTASLHAHENILNKLSEGGKTQVAQNVKKALPSIRNSIKSLKVAQQVAQNVSASSKINVQAAHVPGATTSGGDSIASASAESKVSLAEQTIRDTKNYIEGQKNVLTEESYQRAQSSMKVAAALVTQAKATLRAQQYGKAIGLLEKAISISQEVRVTVSASINLKIEVPQIQEDHDDLNSESDDDATIEDVLETETNERSSTGFHWFQ